MDFLKKKYLLVIVVVLIGSVLYFLFAKSNKSNVEFSFVSFDNYCYPFTQIETFQHFPDSQKIPESFIINNEADYQKLTTYRRIWKEDCNTIQSEFYRSSCVASQACSKKALPSIDFSKYTLLGHYTSGHCGTTDFSRNLNKNDVTKSYKYTIKPINTIFSCSGPAGKSMNWIITPKIPQEYQVNFES